VTDLQDRYVRVNVYDRLYREDTQQERPVRDGQDPEDVEHRRAGEGPTEDDNREKVAGEADQAEAAGDEYADHVYGNVKSVARGVGRHWGCVRVGGRRFGG